MRKTLRKISRYKKREFHSSFTTTQKRPCHSFFELSITKKVFASEFCVSGMLIVVVSLACVSSKTHNLHSFFVVLRTQKGSLCQAFLAKTVETGTKNHCHRSQACLAKKNLGKIEFRAFPKRVSPQILLLESNDYFGTCEHH